MIEKLRLNFYIVNDNIAVAVIKNNGILHHDSKTRAELLYHQ